MSAILASLERFNNPNSIGHPSKKIIHKVRGLSKKLHKIVAVSPATTYPTTTKRNQQELVFSKPKKEYKPRTAKQSRSNNKVKFTKVL